MEAKWWKANFPKARSTCIPGLKPRQPINSAGILRTGFYKPANQGQPPLWKPANQEGTHCTKHASDCQPINNCFIRWRHARARVPSAAGDVRSSLCCGDAERAGPPGLSFYFGHGRVGSWLDRGCNQEAAGKERHCGEWPVQTGTDQKTTRGT